MNGRVDAPIPKRNLDYGNNMNSLFALQDRIPAKQCISLRDPLEGIWTSNEISERFFSSTNMVENILLKTKIVHHCLL